MRRKSRDSLGLTTLHRFGGSAIYPVGLYDMEMECDPGRHLELKASRVEAKAVSYSNGSDEAERNPWVQPIE